MSREPWEPVRVERRAPFRLDAGRSETEVSVIESYEIPALEEYAGWDVVLAPTQSRCFILVSRATGLAAPETGYHVSVSGALAAGIDALRRMGAEKIVRAIARALAEEPRP